MPKYLPSLLVLIQHWQEYLPVAVLENNFIRNFHNPAAQPFLLFILKQLIHSLYGVNLWDLFLTPQKE
jgi:hypothetical protein